MNMGNTTHTPHHLRPQPDIVSLEDACLLVMKSVIMRARLDARGVFLASMDKRSHRHALRNEAQAFLESFLEADD